MKEFIQNREGQNVAVVVEGLGQSGKLAFVMHGLGGSKEQPHIRMMVETFLQNGYTVVSFDATNSFGESDGNYEYATITKHAADLADVIAWASTKEWYVEPFVLCGHSLGAIASALYAKEHADKVKALAPISVVVSGELSFEAHRANPERLGDPDEWKKAGIRISRSHDGKQEKRLKWTHMEDRLKYDLLKDADKFTMPVIMIVGESDDATPVYTQQLLFDKLPGKKELHTIKGALHSFYEKNEREELGQLLDKWMNAL